MSSEFEISFSGRIRNVSVNQKGLAATMNVDLRTGLFDQLLDFLHKDGLRFRADTGEGAVTFLGETAGCTVHRDRTVDVSIKLVRKPGLIDMLLDMNDDQELDFTLSVEYIQPAIDAAGADDTEDDASPPSEAVEEAERLLKGDPPEEADGDDDD